MAGSEVAVVEHGGATAVTVESVEPIKLVVGRVIAGAVGLAVVSADAYDAKVAGHDGLVAITAGKLLLCCDQSLRTAVLMSFH